MADIHFKSPGSAMQLALADFLSKRDERLRQARLDKLREDSEMRLAKATDAQIRNTDAQTESLGETRKAAAELNKVRQQAASDEAFAAQHRPGDEVSDEDVRLHPGLVVAPKPATPYQATTNEMGETGEEQFAQPAQAATFRGDAKQRQAEEVKKALEGVLASNPEVAKHPGVQAALQIAQATGDYSGIYSALAQMTKEQPGAKVGTFEDYLVQKYGPRPTPAQIEEGRKLFGQADDRERAIPFPVVVQTDRGPELLNKGTGTAAPILHSDGTTASFAPTSQQRDYASSLGRTDVVLSGISELADKINVSQGLYAKAMGEAEKLAAKANYDDDVAEYESFVLSFAPTWARALGHTGVLTQQDVDSAKAVLPKPGDSKSLKDRKIARIMKTLGGMEATLPGGTQHPKPVASHETTQPTAPKRIRYDMQGNPLP